MRNRPFIALFLALFLLALAVAWPSGAGASVYEFYGYGARGPAMGGAFTALADDFTAGYYNPAGVMECSRPTLSGGVYLEFPELKVNGASANMDNYAIGWYFGTAMKIPLHGNLKDRIGFTLSGVFPSKNWRAVHFYSPPHYEPYFALIDTQTEHMSLNITSAIRLHPSLSVGGGIMVFICQFPNRLDLSQGAKGTIDMSGWMGLTETSTPVIGIHFKPGELWKPLEGLRLGASYRGEFRVKADIQTALDMGLKVDIRFTGHTMFVPEEVTLGAAYDVTEALTLSFDIEWAHWARMRNPYLKLIVDGLHDTFPLFKDVDLNPEDPDCRDIWIPRIGAEYRMELTGNLQAAWRAGYHYRRSPLPYQTGESNLMDNDRHVYSAGVGLHFASMFGHRFKHPQILNLHMAYNHMPRRKHYKDSDVPASNEGYPSIETEGYILSTALTMTIQF